MAKQSVIKKKPGRPPLQPEQRKRNNVTIRLRDDTKLKVQEAGAAQGRSLSEEIEARLELSLIDEFGDEATRKLMRTLALAKEMTEIATGKSALRDRPTAQAARTAMVAIIDTLLPVATRAEKDRIEPQEGQRRVVSDPQARGLGDNIRDAILEGLGPNLAAIRSNLKRKK